jgi:hypothetical protein
MQSTILQHSKRHFAAMLLAVATLGFFIVPTHAEEAPNMSGPVVEIVTFKLANGVTEDAFIKAGEAAVSFMKTRKGFVSRRLSRSADGTYTDHVTWATIEDAKQSMDASMKEPTLGPFIQSIDPASMKIEHQTLVSQVN